jgi:hypothetical protein
MCDHSIFDSQWLQTFIGFLLGLLSALALEFNRKPKLTVRLKGAELIAGFKHLGAEVENKPPVWWLRWFTHREAAYHATILISVIDWDGRGHFAAPIEGRWSGSPEPPDVANTAGVLSLSAAHALLFRISTQALQRALISRSAIPERRTAIFSITQAIVRSIRPFRTLDSVYNTTATE